MRMSDMEVRKWRVWPPYESVSEIPPIRNDYYKWNILNLCWHGDGVGPKKNSDHPISTYRDGKIYHRRSVRGKGHCATNGVLGWRAWCVDRVILCSLLTKN